MKTIDNLAVCLDCTFLLANGIETDAEQRAADAMALIWPHADLVLACPEDCEGWFSPEDCDGCGDALGGDRHPAVAFLRD